MGLPSSKFKIKATLESFACGRPKNSARAFSHKAAKFDRFSKKGLSN